jgi:hypothetical protein
MALIPTPEELGGSVQDWHDPDWVAGAVAAQVEDLELEERVTVLRTAYETAVRDLAWRDAGVAYALDEEIAP